MNQEQVTVIAYIEVKPGSEKAFLEAASVVVSSTRAETACINYDLHRSDGMPNLFMFYENWTSMAGLQQHARSTHIQIFRNSMGDLLEKPTEIKTYKMVTEPVA